VETARFRRGKRQRGQVGIYTEAGKCEIRFGQLYPDRTKTTTCQVTAGNCKMSRYFPAPVVARVCLARQIPRLPETRLAEKEDASIHHLLIPPQLTSHNCTRQVLPAVLPPPHMFTSTCVFAIKNAGTYLHGLDSQGIGTGQYSHEEEDSRMLRNISTGNPDIEDNSKWPW
jgi:hypothetical protein